MGVRSEGPACNLMHNAWGKQQPCTLGPCLSMPEPPTPLSHPQPQSTTAILITGVDLCDPVLRGQPPEGPGSTHPGAALPLSHLLCAHGCGCDKGALALKRLRQGDVQLLAFQPAFSLS